MDKPRKYLLMGAAVAFAIFMLIEGYATFGNTSGFWLLVLASLAGSMMVLIFSIYTSAKKLAPVKAKAHYNNRAEKR